VTEVSCSHEMGLGQDPGWAHPHPALAQLRHRVGS
jgi:hypothetical protein